MVADGLQSTEVTGNDWADNDDILETIRQWILKVLSAVAISAAANWAPADLAVERNFWSFFPSV